MTTSRREVTIPGWDSLQWRQIVIQGPQQSADVGVKFNHQQSARCGGGFCYKESNHVSSVTRNRFLVWRCLGNVLELVEQSLDVNLCNNAVRFSFPGCCVLPDVAVTELAHAVVVLVATDKTVHRLTFPHPSKLPVVSDNTVTLTGSVEPAHPSVLYNCSSDGLLDSSNYALITIGGGDATLVPTCSSHLSPTGKAIFVLSTHGGSMLVITLPPPGSGDFSQQIELRQTSMMQRLWTGIVPTMMRQSGAVPEMVCGLCLHALGNDVYIFALCRDAKLRIWSTSQWECCHTINLLDYIADVDNLQLADDVQHHLRKTPGDSLRRVGLAACLAFDGKQQVCLLQVEVSNSEMIVHHIANRPLSTDRVLSMCVSRTDVWLLCSALSGQTSVHHSSVDGTQLGSSAWNTVMRDDRYITRLDGTVPVDQSPIGVFADSRTGIAGLVQESYVSLVRPCDELEMVYLSEDGLSSQDVPPPRSGMLSESSSWEDTVCVLQVCRMVSQQFSAPSLEQLDALLDCGDVHAALQLITSLLSSADQSEESSSHDGLSETILRLADIDGLAGTIASLMFLLDVAASTAHVIGSCEAEADPERALWCQKLFSSSLSVLAVSGSLQQIATIRRRMCRDLLLTIYGVLQRRNEIGLSTSEDWTLSSESREQALQLVCMYTALTWTSVTPVQVITQSQLETNIHQLAALSLGDIINTLHASHSVMLANGSSLLELCMAATGGLQLRNVLATRSVFWAPQRLPLFQLLLTSINVIMDFLWALPTNSFFVDFLASRCQYQRIEEFISLNSQQQKGADSAYATFLLGQCYVQSREMDKATDCFIRASQGVDSVDAGPMQRFYADIEHTDSVAHRLVAYYTKIVRLFDQYDWSAQVITIAKAALSVADSSDSNVAILWSSLFKHHLHLQHVQKAYVALCSNPDPVRRQDCLRRLVYVLYEQHAFEELCQLPFVGLEDEVVSIMESRARTVEISSHSYYELLYSFHIMRGSYKKAASSQYECAVRLTSEMPTVKGLQRRAKCLVAAMNALHLVRSDDAWLVRPVDRSSTQDVLKRHHDGTSVVPQDSLHQPITVVDLKDLREEHVLVSARLKLLQRNADAGTSTNPDELLTLLIAAGLFTVALDVSQMFQFPPTPVLEGLAARCVKLTSARSKQLATDVDDGWDWLSANEVSGITSSRSGSVVECAWQLLRHCLFNRVPCDQQSACFRAITVHFLSVSAAIPQWFLDAYKIINPAQLIQLLVQFGRVVDAGNLAIRYMSALMGTGKEEFGIKDAVHAQSPISWLPYTILDHLATSLNNAASPGCTDSSTIECSAKFQEQLQRYYEAVTSSSQSRLHVAMSSSHMYMQAGPV
ncbi:nuclear pore complex protein Nup160-like [Sycon ciliatum]|uniref:nuclear pore complex protein Nup160-like n=1 Tax=Sycon ciliatum TaxID=27933 RepID=UPI0020A938C0|eukprot:scpid19132/ scgid8125/ Nuclear pore complex protein Nup160; 160 kDa nucleoporin; Gene trap locus 1-13 protein; Nucleoporin Nup160